MNISEKIKEMQGDLGKYHVLEKNEEESKGENMIMIMKVEIKQNLEKI